MNHIWYCEYCPPSSSHDAKYRFATQREFVNHIQECHLVHKTENNVEVFICRYGPDNSCLFLSEFPNGVEVSSSRSSRGTPFTSQHDYEKHLVGFHLLRHPVYKHFGSKSLQSEHHVTTPHCKDKPSRKWSVYKSVVNLPAVLNDPNYREVDIFTRLWGDKFENAEVLPSPHLPVITEKHFEDYLSKLGVCKVVDTNSKISTPKCQNHSLTNSHNGTCTSSNSPSYSSSSASSLLQLASKVSGNERPLSLSSISSIPDLYFDKSFNLKDEKTFCQVIPLLPRRLHRGDTATNSSCTLKQLKDPRDEEFRQREAFRHQHDQLVNYLDVVESNIAEQVSKKSSTFFEAIQSHDVIREDLRQVIHQIKDIRHKLHQIDVMNTSDKLKLLRVVRRRENYRRLVDKLKLIASLQAAQPTIQTLLRNNDFCAALDLVSTTKELLHSHLMMDTSNNTKQMVNKNTPSNGVANRLHSKTSNTLICLRDFNAQLNGISNFVHKMVESEFEMALCRFLDPPIEEYSGYNEPDILSCFLGLIRIDRLDFVRFFHAEMLKRVKDISFQHISSVTRTPGSSDPSTDSSTAQQSSMTLRISDQLRNLSFEEWMKFLVNLCNDLKYLLIRGQDVVDIFEKNLCCNQRNKSVENGVINNNSNSPSVSSPPSPATPSSTSHQSTHTISIDKAKELAKCMHETLWDTANTSQRRLTSLVSSRFRLGSSNPVESRLTTATTTTTTPVAAALSTTTTTTNNVSSGNSPNPQKRLSTTTLITSASVDIGSTTGFGEYAFDKVKWCDFRELVKLLSTFQVYVLRAWLRFSDIPVETIIGPQLESAKNSLQHSGTILSSVKNCDPNSTQKSLVRSNRGDTNNKSNLTTTNNGYTSNDQYISSSLQSDLVLRNLVVNMIKLIIDCFHREKCEKLNNLLDQERWQAATCPEQVQQIIDDLLCETDENKAKLQNETVRTQNHLLLNGEQYIIVGTVVLLLPMINAYIKLDEKLPCQPLATEFVLDRLTDLLNHFNSRTCQLVLGAEACEKVDLQRISAKNLALTLRSLQLIINFLPCIRLSLERISKLDFRKISVNEDNFLLTSLYQSNQGLSRNTVNGLDHIEILLKEHIENLLQKLVELLSDPIGPTLSTWYGRPPIPSKEMNEICRNLSKLTGMTGHVLPAKILTSILLRVHNELKVHLRHRISELGIIADGGPQQSLIDSEMLHYIDHLQSLTPQLNKFVDDCSDIWPSYGE
uniref:Vacuolar protein sorting-associated protein 54 n=1 Tax=Trichobilharzia regenti TaxID=157069 RepID=A0AA85JPV9_TRIRE|nr:unnamed protein product [Trichobilharzia regenti]